MRFLYRVKESTQREVVMTEGHLHTYIHTYIHRLIERYEQLKRCTSIHQASSIVQEQKRQRRKKHDDDHSAAAAAAIYGKNKNDETIKTTETSSS